MKNKKTLVVEKPSWYPTREDERRDFSSAETLLNNAIDRLKEAYTLSADHRDAAFELSRAQTCMDGAAILVQRLRRHFEGRSA